jgi:hypothetical protein
VNRSQCSDVKLRTVDATRRSFSSRLAREKRRQESQFKNRQQEWQWKSIILMSTRRDRSNVQASFKVHKRVRQQQAAGGTEDFIESVEF